MGRHRHAIILGALGAATGLVTGLLVEVVADWFGDAGGLVAWLVPGLAYGIVVGGYLHVAVRRSWLALAVLVLAMLASWNLAVRLAVDLYERLEVLFLAGLAAGLAGAVIVAGGAALAWPALRRPGPALLPVALGTAAGALLGQGSGPAFEQNYVLYVVWQGAVAAAIGLAVDRYRPSSHG